MRYANKHGHYELNNFPCCAQIVVLNHSFVDPAHRGEGLGTKYHKKRLNQIEKLGYDYSMCTVVDGNVPQIKILEAAGWKRLDTFFNRETEKVVHVYGRHVREEAKVEQPRPVAVVNAVAPAPVAVPTYHEIFEQVRTIIVDMLGVNANSVTYQSHIEDDLGGDDLDCVELVMAYEEHFGVHISDEDLERHKIVGEMVTSIQGLLHAKANNLD